MQEDGKVNGRGSSACVLPRACDRILALGEGVPGSPEGALYKGPYPPLFMLIVDGRCVGLSEVHVSWRRARFFSSCEP